MGVICESELKTSLAKAAKESNHQKILSPSTIASDA
jgi:hypothetical protein